MKVAICGHRPPKVGGYQLPNPVADVIVQVIDKKLMEVNPEVVYLGMSLGVEQWAADLCAFNDIPFIACIPFNGFDSRWPSSSRAAYSKLLSKAKSVVVTSNTSEYSPKLFKVRNRYMALEADRVWAVWNGSEGNTLSCMSMFSHVGKPLKRVEVLDVPKETWDLAKKIEEANESGPYDKVKFSEAQEAAKAEIAKAVIMKATKWDATSEAAEAAKISLAMAEDIKAVEKASAGGSREVSYASPVTSAAAYKRNIEI